MTYRTDSDSMPQIAHVGPPTSEHKRITQRPKRSFWELDYTKISDIIPPIYHVKELKEIGRKNGKKRVNEAKNHKKTYKSFTALVRVYS